MIEAFGMEWRHLMEKASSDKKSALRHEFVNTMCASWELPRLAEACANAHIERAPAQQLSYDMVVAMASDIMEHDDIWIPGCRQFEFVTDCQVLASIANGKSSIANDSNHTTALRYIINGLGALVQSGFHTRTIVLDPLSWRPRAWNKHADAACNLAMDLRSDFT